MTFGDGSELVGGDVRFSIVTDGRSGRWSLDRVENNPDIASKRHGARDNMAAYHFGGICVSRWVVEGKSSSRAKFKRAFLGGAKIHSVPGRAVE